MVQMIVKELEEGVELRFKHRAASHGKSVEEEVREILCNAIRDEQGPQTGLGSRTAAHFEDKGLDTNLPELRVSRRALRTLEDDRSRHQHALERAGKAPRPDRGSRRCARRPRPLLKDRWCGASHAAWRRRFGFWVVLI